MKRDYYSAAIDALVPNNQTFIENSKVTWIVTPENIPTDGQIAAKIEQLKSIEPYRLLRIERDRLIAQSDWRVTKAKETSTNIPVAWKTYRQALRDLPTNSTPKLDSDDNLDMSSVIWPTPPL
tara:strand:+ start:851 stop:1219 length:369 start_codon:yes stop_codon:yes gene_type:complete